MPVWMDSGDNTPVGNPVERSLIGGLTMVMAGSLLVFLRRDIGLRLLVRRKYVIAGASLVGLSYIETPFDQALSTFAAAMVVLVFFHYWRHIRRIRSGVPEWHTYDTGRSLLFSFLPLPRSLVQVVIEPALCGLVGWWLSQRSNATFYLGWWITISAGMLFFLENAIRVARRESLFDLGDTVVESVNFARKAERFSNPYAGGRTGEPQRRPGILQAALRAIQLALTPGTKRRKANGTDDRQHRR